MRKRFSAIALLLMLVLLASCGLPQTQQPTITASITETAIPSATDTPEQTIIHPQNLSAGDPYAPGLGNAGYDVDHYRLALTLDPGTRLIQADVVIQARSTMDELEQVSLDLIGFEIHHVVLDGKPASFFRHETKLVVDLAQPMSTGTSFELDIAYSGEPLIQKSIYVPFVSHLGMHHQLGSSLFVVAEPDGARYWFPCNDHPRDKAGFRFELTVPAGLTGVANGVLVEQQTNVAQAFPDGAAGDRYIWQHDQPMATAFVTVAVGNYQRLEGTSPNGVTLRHYVFPEQQAEFEAIAPKIGEMIDWMGERFGPYPFEAFGFVTVAGLGASLETQTMVILSTGSIGSEGTLAHELTHMWFGDWVSLDSWGDIWRSEGFATYVSLMWQLRDDPEELEQTMAESKLALSQEDSDYPLNQPPPESMFGQDSYLKGALLVHALRQEMGDEAFFEGLRSYFERYGGGSASHEQFQAVMEEAAGVSLEALFADWFR